MHPIVVIAASEGGLEPLRRIVAALPVPCAAAVFIVWHIGKSRSMLPEILGHITELTVKFAEHGEQWRPGSIYIAPPDRHMMVGQKLIRLNHDARIHFTRPAADPLFISAARDHGKRVLGIVLSGGGNDGAAGLRAIKEQGGLAVLQKPAEAVNPEMPFAALLADHPDLALSAEEIGIKLREFIALPQYSSCDEADRGHT